jgi:uncharacterized protein
MKIRCLSVILLLFAAIAPLLAQSDAPATREDVVKLFDVMEIRDQMRMVMESALKQQRAMIRENLKKHSPEITEEELARMDRASADIMKDLPLDGMIDDMIPVYQKHLTHADVDAMSAFYASPTGQKLLREMPAMTTESMQAAAPRIQAMMDKVMDRAEKMSTEEREKRTQPSKPAPDKN